MANDCVFCKIVAGTIPAYKVYEDTDTIAFLDIHPINSGHTLVIPKRHIPFVHDLDNRIFAHVMTTVKKVMVAIDRSLHPTRTGLIVEGFDVNHAHIKITPLTSPRDIKTAHVPKPTPQSLGSMANTIRKAIENN